MTNLSAYEKLLQLLKDTIEPIEEGDYSNILEKIGDARIVLIGEATHGTKEFYEMRANITQQLIAQKGFMAVAIEADWPDAYQINQYVQGSGNLNGNEQILENFKRFPTWMWRNKSIANFIKWLRIHNDTLKNVENKIGFYGLDLYSLNHSMEAVLEYLEKTDPAAAKEAARHYACFDHDCKEPETYGQLTYMGLKKNCIREVIDQLLILQHHKFDYIKKKIFFSSDEYFYALQNARIIKNAEHYYRSLFEGSAAAWNVRDQHMMETINMLMTHVGTNFNQPPKIIIWAHNSHVGDARATEMAERGKVNVGQLVREHYGEISYSIGFSTYQGTVTSAKKWGGATEIQEVQPGLPSSYEELFHHLNRDRFLLDLHVNNELEHFLHPSRLQRAIGVVYSPDTERDSHYFFTRLPYQFDSIIHIDTTSAVEPLSDQ